MIQKSHTDMKYKKRCLGFKACDMKETEFSLVTSSSPLEIKSREPCKPLEDGNTSLFKAPSNTTKN